MTVSPVCLVRDGAGPFVATTNGVNVTAGNVIEIKLNSITDITDWFLQVTGTDETSTGPTLANVNNITNKVTSAGSVVSFTMPAGAGRAFLFQSTVTGVGGPLATTFALFVVTDVGTRVGAINERLEGSSAFGWATKVNPVFRTGAAILRYDDTNVPAYGSNTIQGALDAIKTLTFAAGGDLSGTATDQTVVRLQNQPVSNSVPTNAQALVFDGVQWAPYNTSDIFTPGGDLSGSATSQTVIQIRTVPVAAVPASNGQFLQMAAGQWTPSAFAPQHDVVSDGWPKLIVERTNRVPYYLPQAFGNIPLGYGLVGAAPTVLSLGEVQFTAAFGEMYAARSDMGDIINQNPARGYVFAAEQVYAFCQAREAEVAEWWLATNENNAIIQIYNGTSQALVQMITPTGIVGSLRYFSYDQTTASVWVFESGSTRVWGYNEVTKAEVFVDAPVAAVNDLFTYLGVVYVCGSLGEVYAYTADTGTPVANTTLGGGLAPVQGGCGASTFVFVGNGEYVYRLEYLTLAVDGSPHHLEQHTFPGNYLAPGCLRIISDVTQLVVVISEQRQLDVLDDIFTTWSVQLKMFIPITRYPGPLRFDTNRSTTAMIPLRGDNQFFFVEDLDTGSPTTRTATSGVLLKYQGLDTYVGRRTVVGYNAGPYNVAEDDYMIGATSYGGSSSGALTINLPDITDAILGRRIMICDLDGDNTIGSSFNLVHTDPLNDSGNLLSAPYDMIELVATNSGGFTGFAPTPSYAWTVTSRTFFGAESAAFEAINEINSFFPAFKARVVTYAKDTDDATAATTTDEIAFWYNQTGTHTISSIWYVPTSALTANETNNATLKIWRRTSTGVSQTLVASLTTDIANWTAHHAVVLTLSESTISSNYVYSFEITKAGSGVVVPKGTIIMQLSQIA